MGNMKTKKHVTYGLFIVILGLFTLTACGGKSIQDDLKSHDWTFNASKGEVLSPSAKFSEKSLTLSGGGFNMTYQYEISNESGKQQIKFTRKKDNETEIRTFSIKKNSDEYTLKPTNEQAKEDTGEVTLIPK